MKIVPKVKYIIYADIRRIENYHDASLYRWENAVLCFNNKNFLPCVYLAGYSVECLLKFAIIKKLFQRNLDRDKKLNLKEIVKNDSEFSVLKTHKIGKLLKLGDKKDVFKGIKENDFQELILWTSEWRYAITHNFDRNLAKKFLESAVILSKELKKELMGEVKIKEFVFKDGGGDNE